ncbi:hypothetical protein NX059_012414 [Plenodomus lindquistii]|nr:hypothetical protein NX059_012414 [Plenodomus lindquistii]
MAPKRPQTARARPAPRPQPPHQVPPAAIPSAPTIGRDKTAEFWRGFQAPPGSQLHNTARFWEDYAKRSRPLGRRHSLGQGFGLRVPAAKPQGIVKKRWDGVQRLVRTAYTKCKADVQRLVHSAYTKYTRCAADVQRVARSTYTTMGRRRTDVQDLARRAYARHRRLAYVVIALSVTGAVCATVFYYPTLEANTIAFRSQADPIINDYNGAYPHFLHTKNSYTLLNIPEPAFEAWVAHPDVFEKAKRVISRDWAPDKWQMRRLPSQEVGVAIFNMYLTAFERFEHYYEDPWCWEYGKGHLALLQPIKDLSGTLAHYSNTVNCTLGATLSTALSAPFTAPEDQDHPPSNDAERAIYYPCSFSKEVTDLWWRVQRSNIPTMSIQRYRTTPEIANASFFSFERLLQEFSYAKAIRPERAYDPPGNQRNERWIKRGDVQDRQCDDLRLSRQRGFPDRQRDKEEFYNEGYYRDEAKVQQAVHIVYNQGTIPIVITGILLAKYMQVKRRREQEDSARSRNSGGGQASRRPSRGRTTRTRGATAEAAGSEGRQASRRPSRGRTTRTRGATADAAGSEGRRRLPRQR